VISNLVKNIPTTATTFPLRVNQRDSFFLILSLNYVCKSLLLVLKFFVGVDEVILESDKVVLNLGQLLLQVLHVLSDLDNNAKLLVRLTQTWNPGCCNSQLEQTPLRAVLSKLSPCRRGG